MNRIFYSLLISLLFCGSISVGQTQRFLLFEEATNASCGPCASQNPAFDALLNANRDKLTAIKYHASWPGYDPMYSHNPTENSTRISYYNITGVPTAVLDGLQKGSPSSFNQSIINSRYNVPSPMNLSMHYYLSEDESIIYLDMLIEALEPLSGDLRAHIAVVEKEIHFTSAPGTNGEKDFLDVMKKMVPGANGTTLEPLETGDYVILQYSWELANIYDMDQIGAVGFVQNNSNREVHQACNASLDPLTPVYNTDLDATEILNVSETNCLGTVAPQLILRNNGADQVTSCDIYYSVNGGDWETYAWTGSLDFLDAETVELPGIDFTVLEQNEIKIYTDLPNGNPDEYVKNDTVTLSFDQAAVTPETVNLLIRTDDNPDEITWEILNSSGEQVANGGPYSDPQTNVQEEIILPYYDCFKFMIYDAGGDGLLMPGFYALFYGGSNTIASGTTFGSVDSAYFEGHTGVSVPEYNTNIEFSVYPNPTKGDVNLSFFLEQADQVNVRLFSPSGKLVQSNELGNLPAGHQNVMVSTSSLAEGIYIMKIETGGRSYTKRIAVIK